MFPKVPLLSTCNWWAPFFYSFTNFFPENNKRYKTFQKHTLEKRYLWWSWKLLLSSVSTFYKWFSDMHFPSQCLFFERAVDFRISLYYTKKCRFAIFLIILLSKSVRRRLSIIKLFLKNFSKITESYIYRRFLFNKVEGYRLKRNSGAGEFL